MRVLYVANSTNASGGDNKSLLTLLRGIRSKGVTPFVVVPDKGGIYGQLVKEGFDVTVVNYRMDVYPNTASVKDILLFVPRLLCRRVIERVAVSKISRLCREKGIDIVHSNVSVLSCGQSAARKSGLPHVAHVREFVDKDFRLHPYPCRKAFYARLKSPHSYIICITRGIQEHHGFSGTNVVQIYNGISESGSGEVSGAAFGGERYFLYAGRIEKSKGVMQLVEAYADFMRKHPCGYSLKLAGGESDPVYSADVRRFVSSCGLDGKVTFLGARRDVAALMRSAQALIVPSVFEAFGRCLPEAMANGCLTIGHDTGGTKEQYDNGLRECGREIGLRYKTTAELSACLSRVYLSKDGEFADVKDCARNIVKKLYSPDSYVNGVCAFYNKILKIES